MIIDDLHTNDKFGFYISTNEQGNTLPLILFFLFKKTKALITNPPIVI